MDETDLLILEGIRQGVVIAILDGDGELTFYHPEHTDDEMIENSLTVSEVERLMRDREAE